MSTIAPLSASYTSARERVLDAATACGATMEHHRHPCTGPDGEGLWVDVISLGPPDAANRLLVVSATHGVEGFAGSALQLHWLEHYVGERPPDVSVTIIHGLNPYGFAWIRRVNEDNVDLNRNFIDWSAPPPSNRDYEQIAALLVPDEWTEAEQARTFTALLEMVADVGMDRMQAIISGGQYTCPTGIFYGGEAPVWSNRWLREWAARALASVRRLGIIDLHTGLGPWGHGELIGHAPSATESHQRSVAWWGDVRSMVDGDSVSAPLTGDWLGAAAALAPTADVTAVALEFGTVDTLSVLQALRADAWLHAHGNPTAPEADAIRSQVRAAFADDDTAWVEALWPRFHNVAARALLALDGGG
jgi:hypothetical protein